MDDDSPVYREVVEIIYFHVVNRLSPRSFYAFYLCER